MQIPVTASMTVQQLVEKLAHRFLADKTEGGTFQVALGVLDPGCPERKLVVTVDLQVAEHAEWPHDLLPSSGVPGQPRMPELERAPAPSSAANGELQWQPMETVPKDRYVHVQQVSTYRWLPYKENSQQRRNGILGRWQRFNGYGWDNDELRGRGWAPAEDAACAPASSDGH